MMASC